MKPNSGNHSEFMEPIQQFLESLTQDLTEKKFVPAFRDELRKLQASLQNLDQSELTLQQIARGVESLRELFAPIGTRLLVGAKDLETVMRSNVDGLRDQAGEFINELTETHVKLEKALHGEAGLLQEQSIATREALARTSTEVEQMLSGLTSTLGKLCQKLENETAQVASTLSSRSQDMTPVPMSQSHAEETVKAVMPEELRDLLARTEQSVLQELERHQQGIEESLRQNQSGEREWLAKLSNRITEALSSVGPNIQDGLENTVSRLRDQIQTLVIAEAQHRPAPAPASQTSESVPSIPIAIPSDFSSALSATETRVLSEIAHLQKGQRNEQTESERILRELAQGLEDTAEHLTRWSDEESKSVRDSLSNLQRLVSGLKEQSKQSNDQLNVVTSNVEALQRLTRENAQSIEQVHQAVGDLDESQRKTIEQKLDEQRQLYSQLAAAISRAEQAATASTELGVSENRATKERIEAGLKDIRNRLERGLTADAERVQDTLRKIAEAWTEALEALRDFIHKTVTGRADMIISHLELLETRIAENGQADSAVRLDLQNSIKRIATIFDERFENLRTNSETASATLEEHVKAISGEVSSWRSKQDQLLAVLKETIRVQSEESANRLREVIERTGGGKVAPSGAAPAAIPAKLTESIDRLIQLLQSQPQPQPVSMAIPMMEPAAPIRDAGQIDDKLDSIIASHRSARDFFSGLAKDIENQSAELDTLHTSHTQQEKALTDLKTELQQSNLSQREIRVEMARNQERIEERSATTTEEIAQIKAAMSTLSNEHLPNLRLAVDTLLSTKLETVKSIMQEQQDQSRREMQEMMKKELSSSKTPLYIAVAVVIIGAAVPIVLQFLQGAGK